MDISLLNVQTFFMCAVKCRIRCHVIKPFQTFFKLRKLRWNLKLKYLKVVDSYHDVCHKPLIVMIIINGSNSTNIPGPTMA